MMRNKIFIDSWGFISLFNTKEQYHIEASKYIHYCLQEKYEFFTSNFIISETITFFYRTLGHTISKPAIDKLFNNIDSGLIINIEISNERMKQALELRYKYHDKPKISFTDLSSIVVMDEFDIKEILTMDKHFEQVNLGFDLRPA